MYVLEAWALPPGAGAQGAGGACPSATEFPVPSGRHGGSRKASAMCREPLNPCLLCAVLGTVQEGRPERSWSQRTGRAGAPASGVRMTPFLERKEAVRVLAPQRLPPQGPSFPLCWGEGTPRPALPTPSLVPLLPGVLGGLASVCP